MKVGKLYKVVSTAAPDEYGRLVNTKAVRFFPAIKITDGCCELSSKIALRNGIVLQPGTVLLFLGNYKDPSPGNSTNRFPTFLFGEQVISSSDNVRSTNAYYEFVEVENET